MLWKNKIFLELRQQDLFIDGTHRTRFKELLDCYANAPFFTAGLCKCMYLSSWDDEHFIIMLDMLNQLSLTNRMTLDDMVENGELMAEEAQEHYSNHIMRLSCCFLTGEPFSIDSLPEDLDPQGLHIIKTALSASDVIDQIPFYRNEEES